MLIESVEVEQPKVVLAIGAHPDDIDFGAGGTVSKWISEGAQVHYLLATTGQSGGFDETIDRSEIPSIRQFEQRAAGDVYGVSSIEFLDFMDGSVTVTPQLRKEISRAIRRVKPDTVISQSPIRNFDRIGASHPDHLATGEAALQAVYPDARNPFAFPELLEEGYEAHSVSQVFLMASAEVNFYVDITSTIDKKVAAIREHKSQLKDPDAVENMVRNWASTYASRFLGAEGLLVEGFRYVNTR